MHVARGLWFASWLVLCASPAWGVDLARIDRTIGREPVYRSGAPKYALLVFGREAETRVWLVLDTPREPWGRDGTKNILYVDRNGNGDLTDPGERVGCTMREGS